MNFENQQTNGLLAQTIPKRNKKASYQDVALWVALGFLAVIGAVYSSNYLSMFISSPYLPPSTFQAGERYTFESSNTKGQYWNIKDLALVIQPSSTFPPEGDAFRFDVVPGLGGDDSVSFRSVEFPSLYIERGGNSFLHLRDGSKQYAPSFKNSASFYLRSGSQKGAFYFESKSNPGYYIVHSHGKLVTQELSASNMDSAAWNPQISKQRTQIFESPLPTPFSLLTTTAGGPVKIGDSIRFNSKNFPNDYLRHSNYEIWKHADDGSVLFKDDSTFIVTAGLAGGDSFSFQSKNYPTYYIVHDGDLMYIKEVVIGTEGAASWYLVDATAEGYYRLESFDNAGQYVRHQGSRGKLHNDDGSALFMDDSSFAIENLSAASEPVANVEMTIGKLVRFRSKNFPNDFLRHSNYEIWKHAEDNSDLFLKDSSFKVVAGLAGDNSYSFQSENYPTYYLTHDGELLYIKEVTTGQEGAASWYIVPTDTTDYFRIESYDLTDQYVRHQGSRGKVHPDDGSNLFSEDASWYILQRDAPAPQTSVPLTVGSTVRINSFNYPDTYLRHSNYEIYQHDDDGSDLFLKDSTFTVVSCLAVGDCYSFESLNYPGYYLFHDGDLLYIREVPAGKEGQASWYIKQSDKPDYYNIESYDLPGQFVRHQGARGKVHPSDGSNLFGDDSKWTFEYLTIAEPEAVQIPAGQFVRFNSYNYPNNYMRHSNYEIWSQDDDDTDLFMSDSTFKVVDGLAGGKSTSFESKNYPGYYLFHDGELVYIRQVAPGQEEQASWYLIDTSTPSYYRLESVDLPNQYIRHQGSRGKVHPDDGSNLFNEDSQWAIEYIREEADPVLTLGSNIRFRSENYPNDFLRHSNYEIWKHPEDSSDLFLADSTFIVREGLEGLGSYSFESYNYPGYYLYHENDLLYIKQVAAGTEGRASWNVKASNGDYIKLESFDKLDHFVRHQNSRAKLHKSDSTELFNDDSNFLIETRSNVTPYASLLPVGSTARLQSQNFPGHYLRHQNYEIWKHSDDGSSLFNQDSSFRIRAGLAGDNSISLESVNFPGYYLYHDNDLLYIRQVAAGKEGKASWYERDSNSNYVKLESFDKPGYFARHQNSRGKLHQDDGSSLFNEDSNWAISNPTIATPVPSTDYTGTVVTGQRYGFRAQDRNDQFWKHANFQGIIDPNLNDPITDDNYLFDVVDGLAGTGTVSFRSVNYPDRYLRQKNKFITLESGNDQTFRDDASFYVRNGYYGDGGVAFESKTHPGHYIAHDNNYNLILKAWDGTQDTNKAITWVAEEQATEPPPPTYPLTTGSTIRMTPKGSPSEFFRQTNFEIWMSPDDSSEAFYEDSSFIVENGLTGTGTVSLRSVNHPTYFLYHDGLYLYIGLVPSGNEGKASFYARQSSQGDYARFESFDMLEYFIGSEDDRGVLLHNDGTSAVNDKISWSIFEQNEMTDPYDHNLQFDHAYAFMSSTETNHYWKHSNFALWEVENNGDVALDPNFQFVVVEGFAGPGTVSFRSVNYPDRYLRHSNCDVWLHKGSGVAFGDSASFHVRTGLHGLGGISFESFDSPNHYIRVDVDRLSVDKLDCCDNFRADGTFYAVEVPTAAPEAFSPDDIFVALMNANLQVKVTQEVLTTEMVTNANEQILLRLISYDETLQREALFQQTGGTTYMNDDPLRVDISIPYYNFDKGTLDFQKTEVNDIVFGITQTTDINFSDTVQVAFDPMGFYRVTVFVSKVVVDASFTATNENGQSISAIYTLVDYSDPLVQVNLIGQATKNIVISDSFGSSTFCNNC